MDVSIFMGIVCLVVVCGNFFVLYALVSQPSLHTTTNFLVLSLTISDLLLGIAIIPFAIIQVMSCFRSNVPRMISSCRYAAMAGAKLIGM